MSEPAWRTFTAEQQRAAFLVDRPVLASAGAGAGKTAVMAVRFVACLLSREGAGWLTPDRILAVSFTREAAANLRARIERTLRTVLKVNAFPRLVAGEGFEEAELVPEHRDHLRRCLRVLPAAPIATVDALCLQWVAEHAAILGRDPDLRPPEAVAWEQVREQAWQALCAEQLAVPHSDLVRLVEAYGARAVQERVQRLGDQAAALPQPCLSAMAGDAVALVAERRAVLLEALTDAMHDARVLPEKGKVLDALRALPGEPPTEAAKLCTWLAALDGLSLAGVRIEAVKEVIRTIQDLVDFPSQRSADDRRPDRSVRVGCASLAGLGRHDGELEAVLHERAQAFAQVASTWLGHLERCAARAQLAGFASVEAQALALLNDPGVRRRLGTRYRHVLLDEAQDLNRLQGTLVEALQAGGGEQSARVFVVGDHRQSIYGFRHADPAIFGAWEAAIGQRGGVAAQLAENFRSHPDLLERVRAVFAQDSLGVAFRPEGIAAGRTAESFPGRAGRLCGWRVAAAMDGAVVELRPQTVAVSEAQARHTASLIATSLSSGRRPEDHAILLRTRGRMRLYAQALERAGIPYDTDFPGGLYDAQECHDVEAVLRLCVNPHDRRALAIALGGPWGAADPQDRTLMVDCLALAPDAGWARARAHAPIGEVVSNARVVLANEGVAAVLRLLMRDQRLTARYGTLPLARRRLANLARLAEEEQTAGTALDAAAFVARLAERRRLGVDSEEASGEHLGSRGVRLMTIHQSKGLEWPVVYLPDLHRPFDRRDLMAKALGHPRDDGLEIACHPGDADVEDGIGLKAGLIADTLRQRIQAEEARLFYVACTRASEELHGLIPALDPAGPLRDGSVRCAADWWQGAGMPWEDVIVAMDQSPGRLAMTGEALPPLPPLPPLPAATEAELPVQTVSDLLPHEPLGERGEVRPAAVSGLSRSQAQALGTTVHQLLEHHGPGMDRSVAMAALAGFAEYLGAERWNTLLARLGDRELLPGYWSAANRLIEQPVIGEGDDGIVIGTCDVLLQDGTGGWHLYDWKTGEGAISTASQQQVQLYARLVGPHLDGPLLSAGLVDVERGVVIPVVW